MGSENVEPFVHPTTAGRLKACAVLNETISGCGKALHYYNGFLLVLL